MALVGVGLTLLTHREVDAETWGYWMFARIFSDTGTFVTPDRSPLYTLYLNAFLWLGYSGAAMAEHVVTSLAILGAITGFFRRYLGLGIALLAALLWLPFLQASSPPVQGLALACSLWSLVLRRREKESTALAGSYALLAVAYMLRPSYLIFIVLFATWDLFRLVRTQGARDLVLSIRTRAVSIWPVVPVIALLLWFSLAQSGHQWNNANFASST